jgi:anti-anti-sigma factor
MTVPVSLQHAVHHGLQLGVVKTGTTHTIHPGGEWDLTATKAVDEAERDARQPQPETLLLDLTDLSFLDSTGIAAAVDLAKRCARQDSRLVIIPGPRAVQRVFEMCGLTNTLPFMARTGSQQGPSFP